MKKKVPAPSPGTTCDHRIQIGGPPECHELASMAHSEPDGTWTFVCAKHACPHCEQPGMMFEPYCFHSWRPHTKLKAKCTKCQKQTPWMELLEEWGCA
jgi:hypothetical protein